MRILLIQTAFLGDIVMTTPLVREIRRRHPTAQIQMLTTEIGREALGGMAEIDRWLVLDKRWNRRGRQVYARLLWTLAREQFDIGIAAQRSIRSGVMLRLANPRLSIGFDAAPGAWAYGVRVPWKSASHAVDRYLDLAAALGPARPGIDRTPSLPITDASRADAARLIAACGLSSRHRIVTLAPGSRWKTKRWNAAGFADVAIELTRRGLRPILIGSADERALCESIARSSGIDLPLFAGRTSVGQLAALIQRSELTVANDSGAAHVAAAVGTPVVTIFGPTDPTQGYVPRGATVGVVARDDLDCRPCGSHGGARCPLRHHACMSGLDSSSVMDSIDALLATPTIERSARAYPASALPG